MLVVHLKSEHTYVDLTGDVEKRFYSHRKKPKKMTGLMKDELGGKIMK